MRSSARARTLATTLLTILQFVILFPCVDAVNLHACGARLLGQQNATNTTGSGLRISYEECLAECGPGLGSIDWQDFSQNFGAWFLPWISLMFQIPFGAERPLDDIVSFFLTIGCPALAAYSLQITHLNKHWITAELLDVEYPNSEHVATALAALHHVPIQIEYRPPFLHSLIVLLENDKFWSRLAAANTTRRWSIPLVMSYVLAVFALLLTIADSIVNLPYQSGFSIASVWTFLLPLIIGWLHVGCEPEPSHLRKTLAAANQNVWVATEHRGHPVKMTFPKAIEFARASSVDADGGVDLARNDELKPVPVFNYSRAFVTPMIASTVLRLMKKAAANAKQETPVGNSEDVGRVAVWAENEAGKISSQNRVGTDAEVVEYCTRVLQQPKRHSDSITPFEIQSSEMTLSMHPPLDYGFIVPSRWAPGIWKRVVVASVLALGLQWGTVGAAFFLQYTTPPKGLGCRALSFLLYSVAATFAFLLFLASSILAHMSRPLPGQAPTPSWLRTCQGTGATVCRWSGKCLAIASAIGILLVCFFHVNSMFNNCYCSSTSFSMEDRFVVFSGINYTTDFGVVWIWVGALAFAFLTATLFGFSMYASLPPRR